MTENEIASIVVDFCYNIHVECGPGLFESVYEEILCYELSMIGIPYNRQHPVPVIYNDIKLEAGFRADVIVDNKVIIELKSVSELSEVHFKQVQTYLKLTNLKLGLLINFNVPLIKNGIRRIVNNL